MESIDKLNEDFSQLNIRLTDFLYISPQLEDSKKYKELIDKTLSQKPKTSELEFVQQKQKWSEKPGFPVFFIGNLRESLDPRKISPSLYLFEISYPEAEGMMKGKIVVPNVKSDVVFFCFRHDFGRFHQNIPDGLVYLMSSFQKKQRYILELTIYVKGTLAIPGLPMFTSEKYDNVKDIRVLRFYYNLKFNYVTQENTDSMEKLDEILQEKPLKKNVSPTSATNPSERVYPALALKSATFLNDILSKDPFYPLKIRLIEPTDQVQGNILFYVSFLTGRIESSINERKATGYYEQLKTVNNREFRRAILGFKTVGSDWSVPKVKINDSEIPVFDYFLINDGKQFVPDLKYNENTVQKVIDFVNMKYE